MKNGKFGKRGKQLKASDVHRLSGDFYIWSLYDNDNDNDTTHPPNQPTHPPPTTDDDGVLYTIYDSGERIIVVTGYHLAPWRVAGGGWRTRTRTRRKKSQAGDLSIALTKKQRPIIIFIACMIRFLFVCLFVCSCCCSSCFSLSLSLHTLFRVLLYFTFVTRHYYLPYWLINKYFQVTRECFFVCMAKHCAEQKKKKTLWLWPVSETSRCCVNRIIEQTVQTSSSRFYTSFNLVR